MTNSNYSPVDPLPGLVQEYIKTSLAEAFISQNIITVIEVDWHGRVEIKSQNWQQYWEISNGLPENVRNSFLCLEKARNKYFDSGFQSDYIKDYCYWYFVFLTDLLKFRNEPYTQKLLCKLISLENFIICWYSREAGIVAGTTSHRNPAYLLARLGKQSFNEDPKYLPLIMLNCSSGNKLFYHYRQYRISSDPDFSIFVYPAASLDERSESFALVESFTSGFSRKSDPRSKQRAKLLTEFAIHPFLKALLAKNNDEKRDINMVDLGGGSGIVLRHVWEDILRKNPHFKENWYLNCSIVGLRVQNPIRHFSRGSIRANMAYADYHQIDYIDWISKQAEAFQFDIALICRLLNNLSIFDIEGSDDEGVLWYISGQQILPEVIINRTYNPVHCLCPERYCPDNLIQTNGRTRLSENQVAYRVLSLTDYYAAIKHCIGASIEAIPNMVFYPIRRFNDSALFDGRGESIIGKLSKIAKLTVIEDVDLTANYLAKHIRDHKLNSVMSAANIDSQHSSQVLAVCDRRYAGILPGTKIC